MYTSSDGVYTSSDGVYTSSDGVYTCSDELLHTMGRWMHHCEIKRQREGRVGRGGGGGEGQEEDEGQWLPTDSVGQNTRHDRLKRCFGVYLHRAGGWVVNPRDNE